jgi:hypothetical protein
MASAADLARVNDELYDEAFGAGDPVNPVGDEPNALATLRELQRLQAESAAAATIAEERAAWRATTPSSALRAAGEFLRDAPRDLAAGAGLADALTAGDRLRGLGTLLVVFGVAGIVLSLALD